MSINNNRPKVRVFNAECKPVDSVKLPAVFKSPIRNDIVQFVQTNLGKNKQQPYGVSQNAGMQSSAESWGTGRAVARIPRVPGGGTHRAGQGAFGNMCRKGRSFAPLRVWRRWHRKVHVNQKRFAVASALAASSIAPLVQARGHRIDNVPEIPLVVANDAIEPIAKTKKAVAFLKAIGALDDHIKAKESRHMRAGKGKARNRRFVHRRGPLIVHDLNGDAPLVRAFRNLTGIEFLRVEALNPLVLAPGGHIGRFIIWTRSAFEKLDSIFGTLRTTSQHKADYRLPRSIMTNDDISRVIKSDQIQNILRPYKRPTHTQHAPRINALTNPARLAKISPYAAKHKQLVQVIMKRNIERKAAEKLKKPAKAARALQESQAKKGVKPPKGSKRNVNEKKVKAAAWRKLTLGF